MLLSGEIVHEDASAPGWIELNAGRITKVGAGPPPHQPDLTGTWISPGLVDLQVNGAQGYEVTDGPTALESIDRALLRCGTTSYLATIISTSDTIATEAVDAFSHHQASQHPTPLVGIHLEGPFLNPTRRGVHLAEVLQTPHLPLPTYYNHPLVRLVTLAPELPGSQYLIKELTARGIVVSLGHSAATADQAQQAADSGAKMVTHLFNGMTPFHHRQSDLVGWALAQSELLSFRY
jgi:N-acetylglucosamine-6-phosphate deacetylase